MLNQLLILFLLSFSTRLWVSSASGALSIYDALQNHGLPIGLLPKGVTDFRLDNAGTFEVHLDHECNAKFEDELHYDRNITGILSPGKISNVSGISAQDLFLWFNVKEISVDVPSSGVIYFDVGVVVKQFSVSPFETPRDCVAVQQKDLLDGSFIKETSSESQYGKLRYPLDEVDSMRAVS